MSISAKLVMELRAKTNAGMMDCKKALIENNGDMEAAALWLREKGISKAAKKASRIAAEGLVFEASNQDVAVLVEFNSETDFVAKNEEFINFGSITPVKNKALSILAFPNTVRYSCNTVFSAPLI